MSKEKVSDASARSDSYISPSPRRHRQTIQSRLSNATISSFGSSGAQAMDDRKSFLSATTVMRDAPTPPPSPSVLEKGKAGCNLFRERKHLVHPSYQEDNYQRLFTAKLILGNICTYIPTVFIMVIITSYSNHLDYQLIHEGASYVLTAFILGILGAAVYVYFVGIFRKPPMLYVAFGIKTCLNTCIFSCGMMLIHIVFLKIIDHPTTPEHEFNLTRTALGYERAQRGYEEIIDHAPPYMAILTILLMISVQGGIAYLLVKHKFAVTDYRIPFLIYTSCFSMSAFLITVVLHGGFKNEPVAYDVFQVITACYLASLMLMRTPHFTGRLFEGKVCPLEEGEFLYALLHYGL